MGNFRPWSHYQLVVADEGGCEILLETVKHYYSHWQVHQLYRIQQFPDLYRNAWLVGLIPDDHPWKDFYPRAPEYERLADFDGKGHGFDALSFWAVAYDRQCGRTFAGTAEIDGIRNLDDARAEEHRNKLADLACNVLERFRLTVTDLYRFLWELVDLYEEYVDAERYKIAGALREDIFHCFRLVNLLTGETRDQVSDHLGPGKETFRHLWVATKERDYALRILNVTSRGLLGTLQGLGCPDWDFDVSGGDSLLDYCRDQGLGLLPAALSGMEAIDSEEFRQKSRRVLMYTNLKNVLTSFEYLLKTLARGNVDLGNSLTLTPVIEKIFGAEAWYQRFRECVDQGMVSAKSTADFLGKLDSLLQDESFRESADGYWAQHFLLVCLARNGTVHWYPSEDWYYGGAFGSMWNAAVIAMLYAWKFAHTENWTLRAEYFAELST